MYTLNLGDAQLVVDLHEESESVTFVRALRDDNFHTTTVQGKLALIDIQPEAVLEGVTYALVTQKDSMVMVSVLLFDTKTDNVHEMRWAFDNEGVDLTQHVLSAKASHEDECFYLTVWDKKDVLRRFTLSIEKE